MGRIGTLQCAACTSACNTTQVHCCPAHRPLHCTQTEKELQAGGEVKELQAEVDEISKRCDFAPAIAVLLYGLARGACWAGGGK